MPPAGPAPPRVSRETRLLLVTALIALFALWALARIRFPDRPVSPNPLPPVLTQLAPRSPFEEIPALVAELTPRLAPWIVPVSLEGHPADGRTRAALRIDDETAVLLLDDAVGTAGETIIAHDPASGLAVVRVRTHTVPEPATWTPRRLDLPRYLLTADLAAEAVSFQPVFVGALLAAPSEVWRDTIWLLPGRSEMLRGDLVFTIDGAFAGLVVSVADRPALVPGHAVLALAHRLTHDPPPPAADLGVHVQPLTEAIARATGAPAGVVITYVEPDSPAASHLAVTDVIQAVDDRPITSLEGWRARMAGLAPGGSVTLGVRRAGAVERVVVTARGPEEALSPPPHGLTMRTLTGTGVEVLRVEPRSAGARAGLEPGDVIRVFNGIRSPTAMQVGRAFAAAPDDRPVLVAITRGADHHVLTMQRRR
jgi:hypothetical protein